MGEKEFELCGFTFVSNFDSANLSRVEYVPRKPIEPQPKPDSPVKKRCTNNSNNSCNNRFSQKRLKTNATDSPDYEFNIWTNPDCSGTEFENSNRTWFHFGVRGGTPYSLVKLNVVDLNKQSKMYSQGMAPVYKISPGRNQWERIQDKPVFTSENNVFTLSFKYRALENPNATIYFAFTYPFSYTELQNYLANIDEVMSKPENHLPKAEIRFSKGLRINNDINDAIYYHRETLCYSLEYRKVDLITISSHHNITSEREPRIENCFPDDQVPRPFRFQDKKVIFISARVHPGETPSSFVFNGLLNLLIQKDDPIAILLRRLYVFKLIPMLNPDGVFRGHYRTDTRGCNLNRFYLNPSCELHPSIYAARALIRYHHYGALVPDEICRKVLTDESSQVDPTELESHSQFKFKMSRQQKDVFIPCLNQSSSEIESSTSEEAMFKTSADVFDAHMKDLSVTNSTLSSESNDKEVFLTPMSATRRRVSERVKKTKPKTEPSTPGKSDILCSSRARSRRDSPSISESGLFLYIDMHGHASKKGIFMYGNHFDKIEESVECMLLPKIMSLNSQNFHFPACNFTERNMYLRDKRDGTTREGSGRVAVLRITGLVRSYTLECNYNTGRIVNTLSPCARDLPGLKTNTNLITPPKYSPAVFEEMGRSLGISILDLTNSNPWSRIPSSEFHTLFGIRDWLKLKTISDSFLYQRAPAKGSARSRSLAKSSQTQVMMGILSAEKKLIPNVRLTPLHRKQKTEEENNGEDSERKENLTSFQLSGKSSSLVLGRKQSVAASRRTINRIGNVLQVHRSGTSRSMRSVAGSSSKKSGYRNMGGTAEKLSKFKTFTHSSEIPGDEHPGGDSEGRVPISKVSISLNCERGKISDSCVFKENSKRLKMSGKGDGENTKLKSCDWGKEDAIPGPSSEMIVYSRISRPLTHLAGSSESFSHGKKRSLKSRPQLSPVKYKKSLELRKGTEVNRKKMKNLFKKAGKVVLSANDVNKNLIERVKSGRGKHEKLSMTQLP